MEIMEESKLNSENMENMEESKLNSENGQYGRKAG